LKIKQSQNAVFLGLTEKSFMNLLLRQTSLFFIPFVTLNFFTTANAQPMHVKNEIANEQRVVEIRTYNLKENSRDAFHQLFKDKAMPMLKKWEIHVVGYGPSLHDKNTYTLIREYQSIEHMQKSEDAFYASDEWRTGPREAILALIENYTTLVLPADQRLIDELTKSLRQQ
jgi:hypothetical protein